MPTSVLPPRRRVRLAAIALVGVVALFLTSCSPEQMAALDRINTSRTQNGVSSLIANPTAMNKAQAWAEQLAATNSLRHSVLANGIDPGWVRLAENVGHGRTVEEVHASFLNSPPHRANMMFPGWNSAATGIATAADGTVYVVQVFLQYP
jgi:uncharacterized protein YkwD